MPINPSKKRTDEQDDFAIIGPFGGIQSEAPLERIESFGFADAVNIFFRKGRADTRCALNIPNNVLNGPIVGVSDFFDVNGSRHQVVMTPTRLYPWSPGNPGSFAAFLAGVLTGAPTQLFTSTCVANKLLFCQGTDKVQFWDGISGTINPISPNAVPAKYLFELGFHLIAMNTIEGGVSATQRVRWTGAGDPTDWTSFNAGQVDLFNDLGPINNGCKLYQSGFAFQQWGITQIIPTGNGLAPFAFVPMGAKAEGNVIPYSLSAYGLKMASYVGKNNVYIFDGSQSYPIGDMRVDGSYNRGARKRIFADLVQCDTNQVFGYISTTIAGNDYFAYWLFMPQLNQAWVYHFDEQSWTRETFGVTPSIAGDFFAQQSPRIIDLIGTIAQQQWTPAGLLGGSPFDSMLIGLTNSIPAYMDFTGVSETPWSITSGSGAFGDYKHKKTVSAVRLVLEDNQANFTALLTLTNNKGLSQSQPIGPIGTGSGASMTVIIPFQPQINGTYITWKISGDAGQQLALSEIAPIYDISGEVRAGKVD